MIYGREGEFLEEGGYLKCGEVCNGWALTLEGNHIVCGGVLLLGLYSLSEWALMLDRALPYLYGRISGVMTLFEKSFPVTLFVDC